MANTFIGYAVANTPKAILFQDHFWHTPSWMPKSQIEVFREDDTEELIVKATPWICKQKRLDEFTEYSEEDIKEREAR